MITSKAAIRDALFILQGGRCAVCGDPQKLVVDHDHATGLARGLLCRSCNCREGKGVSYPDIELYLANPPTAGQRWLWELPDAWTSEDTAAVRRLCNSPGGLPVAAILDYMPQHLAGVAARDAALQERVLALGRADTWAEDGTS